MQDSLSESSMDVLPSDPNDRYYYTNCFVCKAKAKAGTEYMHNYGGLVCFSCRAFWRRAHKRTKVPNFSCSRDENCVITVSNRRKCKRCRYRLCQIAGMTESAILTEEQKKMRFRKMIQKREQMMSIKNEENEEKMALSNHCDTGFIQQISIENVSPSQENCSKCMNTTGSAVSVSMEVDNMINEYESNRNYEPTCCKSNEIVKKRKESILTCFEITLGLTNSTADEELFAIWNPHLREDFLTHFANVAEEFRNFALFQRHFCQLTFEAQEHLLATNTPLFNQLHLACCLLDHRGSDPNCDPMHVQHLYMSRLESIGQLFESKADLEFFCSLVMRLKIIQDITSMEKQAVLAYIILFNMTDDETVCHISKGTIEDLLILNEVFFKRCIGKNKESFGIEDLISILEQMSNLCCNKMGMNLKSFSPDLSPPSSYQMENSWIESNPPSQSPENSSLM